MKKPQNRTINLKLTQPMMHGSAVKKLQELGDALGFDNGVNDGIFGIKTRKTVFEIQRKFELKVDGICGAITWQKILDEIDKKSGETFGRHSIDIRGNHARPKLYARQRPFSDIVGVTLHQTGCNMPKNPRGWHRLNAHIGITQEGKVVYVNDFKDMIWHAQGLSKSTIGIEIEGNYCGIQRNLSTLWKGGGDQAHLNLNMHLALKDVFDFIKSEFDANDVKWKNIFAHRQSSATRRGDCGSEIWKAVALPWAKKLRLKNADGGEGWCKGDGRPIPKNWNPERKAKY